MAAIRLEDEARKDPRFGILGKRLGTSKFDARGRMEELWAYCTEKQTYFLSAQIIDELAEFSGFAQLICEPEVSLGEESSSGIRIKGTRGRIEWIAKLRKNGKKGGRPRKTKPKPNDNQNETRIEPPSNPTTIVTTTTTALVNSNTGEVVNAARDAAELGVKDFIAAYKTAFKERPEYGVYPELTGKNIGAAKQLVKDLGAARAIKLVRVYLAMNKPWFLEKKHDLETFRQNLNDVVITADTGRELSTSRYKSKSEQRANAYEQQRLAILKGEI